MPNPQDVQKLIQALGGDAYAQQIYDSGQAANRLAGQNAMEQNNSRGILNSTVTADRVAQVNSAGMSDIYGKLLNYSNQKKQQDEAKRQWQASYDLQKQTADQNNNYRMGSLAAQNAQYSQPNYGSTSNTKATADQYYNTVLGTRGSATDASAQLNRDYGLGYLQKIMSESDIADLRNKLQGYDTGGSSVLNGFGSGKQWSQNTRIQNPLSGFWNQYDLGWKYQK